MPIPDPARDALAPLRALPAPWLNRVAATMVCYARWPLPVFARSADRRAAETAGMRHIGNCVEWFALSLLFFATQVWVDGPGLTQARLSWRGYWFCTYFESGKCIITWNHVPQTPSGDNLESRAGGAGFAPDSQAHAEAVDRLRARGEVPVLVDHVRVAAALGRHYYRFILPGQALVPIFMVQGMTLLLLYEVLKVLLRHGRGR